MLDFSGKAIAWKQLDAFRKRVLEIKGGEGICHSYAAYLHATLAVSISEETISQKKIMPLKMCLVSIAFCVLMKIIVLYDHLFCC